MQRRVPVLLLALACLLPFIRLGMGDILPWDESLYVIRAQACLQFGAWLDQATYAAGGLYSGWHPPFGVWLIAFSEKLLGASTLSLRLPLALAASGSILILWFLVKRFASRESALLAAVSVASSDLFLLYSHRAQMECMILFFSVAAIYVLVHAIDRDRWALAVASGLLLGLALLTKLGYALYIVPFVTLLPWSLEKPRTVRFVGVMLAVGIGMGLAWFGMMCDFHPGFIGYVHHYLQTFRSGTYAPSSLAWWYYFNRLLVALPLLVMFVLVRGTTRVTKAAAIWLLAVLIVLQLVQTRMPHFASLLLAPGAVLIGLGWDRIGSTSPKQRMLLFAVLMLSIGWSASEQLRLFVTHRLPWNEIEIPAIGIIILAITILVAITFWFSTKDANRFAIVLSTVLVGIALAHLFSLDESENIDGASNIAALLPTLPQKSNLVVIHSDFPNEELAPQLAYYSGGWTLGWIPGKTSRAITWDSATTSNYHPDSAHDIAIVTRFEDRFYHRPASEIASWDSLRSKLRDEFSHERDYRSYFMFY